MYATSVMFINKTAGKRKILKEAVDKSNIFKYFFS